MKRKYIYFIAALLVASLPVYAVFNEKDLGQTLSVLRYELRQDYMKISHSRDNLHSRDHAQHNQMVDMMKKCNELSLMLYSQKQDFTFDMTYALKSVTKEYESFNDNKLPFDNIIARLDLEIDRYSRLVESLRRLPPQLRDVDDLPDSLKYHNDSVNFDMPIHVHDHDERFCIEPDHPFMLDEQGQVDRDSCLFYATTLLKMYSTVKDKIIMDSEHYSDASDRLKESYDYAQNRYRVLQKRIFVDGQDNYLRVLTHFMAYWRKAWQDTVNKYSSAVSVTDDGRVLDSEWKGPMVLGFIGVILLYLVLSAVLGTVVAKLVNKYVKRLGNRRIGSHEKCLILFCACAIFALALMVVVQFVDHNFFAVACNLLLVFAWLMAAITLSLYIRHNDSRISGAMSIFTPVMIIGMVVIVFRIIFIPNSLVNIVFPLLLLAFFFWQLHICRRDGVQVGGSDRVMGWITLAVFALSTAITMAGYVFIGILLIIWWLFQVASIESIIAIYELLGRYERSSLTGKLSRYSNVSEARVRNGEFIRETWFFDLVKYTLVPVVTILSVPFCVRMAADVFDFTDLYKEIVYTPLFSLYDANTNPILHISLFKVILVATLFFVFRYINYAGRSVYRDARLSREIKRNGGAHVHTNQINFTLANNVISILVWGVFIVMVILLCKIPVGAISVIFAGLATGLGLAMKDILNNFIYGIQLMSGRLRVGDWVECDGVRGKVSEISYQSTQIETVDGAVMSFLNTALFNKNFKNLTRNHSYEFLKISVGVAYGADVERVRAIILEALEPQRCKDRYGRDIVKEDYGIVVAFDEFGDSSVDIAVRQFVLVSERTAYMSRAKEAIYNALNENGIEIPFPQRDIHIIQ